MPDNDHPDPYPQVHSPNDWRDLCEQGRYGLRQNLHNALLALRIDPDWTARFAFDEMRQCAILDFDPIQDIDVFRIHAWMQGRGRLETIALSIVQEAVETVARDNPFHPIKLYLDNLQWDGTLRMADWLSTYLGAEANPVHQQIGSMFLVSMIARIMEPGCKADHMLVLEGPQGIGKSRACRILAGDEYFSDTIPDLSGDAVRIAMHLRGKWIIEVPELSAFTAAEATRLKAFLSTLVEQYTPKYGRREVYEPRQCVFIGTTNDDAYLKDETGGRRFWCVKCGAINVALLTRDRDQLLAEARDAYLNHAQWWPDPLFERHHIAPTQLARLWHDAWEETVAAYLAARYQVTLLEIAIEAIGIPKERFDRKHQHRLAAILRTLGWERGRSTGGTHVWKPAARQ